MLVSKHIIDEATKLLKEQVELPHQITSAPEFYVTEATDSSVRAFAVFKHEGNIFKIGTRK